MRLLISGGIVGSSPTLGASVKQLCRLRGVYMVLGISLSLVGAGWLVAAGNETRYVIILN